MRAVRDLLLALALAPLLSSAVPAQDRRDEVPEESVIYELMTGDSRVPDRADPAYMKPFLEGVRAPGAGPGTERSLRLSREIMRVINEMHPLLMELQQMTDAYSLAPDPRPLFRRRQRVLQDLRPRIARFRRMRAELRQGRAASDMQRAARAADDFFHKRQVSEGVREDYVRSRLLSETVREIRSFEGGLKETMARESAAFETARREYVFWRRVKLGAGAAGFLLLLGVLYLFRRRMRPAATAPAVPVTGTAGAPAPQPPRTPELAAGSVLADNYRVEKELGRGGMGVVYRARDMTLERSVAVKRMNEVMAKAGRELDRFLTEARVVAKLKHPNLVEIYTVLKEPDGVYLVFEYVEGVPLHAYIRKTGRMRIELVKSVLRQVGSALDYAHSQKVIHRDLKPSNIMVCRDGTAKVMDFGIAHQARRTVARLTRAGVWGTPPYMAPEQELGQACRESDLFSLGACFYAMATAAEPFSGPNYLAQKQSALFVLPTKIVPGLPGEADAFARKALAPDPKERFHSGKEFIEALEAFA